ncbi:hypothetical protein FBQ95_00010 [Chloroflexi bacterium CFX3]|nr:hypothetical protein [Chloroflexi bacterium CFX3]
MTNRQVFVQKLLKALETANESNAEELSREIMNAFIAFASQTPPDLKCYECIEYGITHSNHSGQKVYGLKIRNKTVRVSAVVSFLQDIELQEAIRQHIMGVGGEYSQLSTEEIQAAIRMATVIIFALERRFAPYNEMWEKLRQFQDIEVSDDGVEI